LILLQCQILLKYIEFQMNDGGTHF
jgi:hypothetical protein